MLGPEVEHQPQNQVEFSQQFHRLVGLGDGARIERGQVGLQLFERLYIQIDHVTRRVIGELDVLAQVRLQLHVGEIEFGIEKRRGQIEQPVDGEHAHMRILAHGVGEVAGHVGLAEGCGGPPPPPPSNRRADANGPTPG